MIAALIATEVDHTFAQLLTDLLLLVVVGINVAAGWYAGLLRRVVAFAGIYLGLFAATYLGNPIAGAVAPHSLYSNAWAFVIIFIVTIVMVEIMGVLYVDRIKAIASMAFDRAWGTVAGVVVGICEMGVLFLVAGAIGNAPAPSAGNLTPPGYRSVQQTVSTATLSGYVAELSPAFERVFGVALPADLAAHLTEGTLSAPQQ